MLFLIEYDRSKGEIVTFQKFGNHEWEAAEGSRLDMELDLHRHSVEHEVVLLEAENEEALRRTHRRYFEDLEQLVS